MTIRQFCIQLIILSVATTFLSVIANRMLQFPGLLDVAFMSIIFFMVFSIGIYLMARKSVESPNKFAFNNIIIISFGIKLVISLLFLMVYKKVVNPESNYFVLPYLLIYIVYTIFETYFLTRLSNPKK